MAPIVADGKRMDIPLVQLAGVQNTAMRPATNICALNFNLKSSILLIKHCRLLI